MLHLDFRLDLSVYHPLANVAYRRSGRWAAETEVVDRFAADHDIPADGHWFHQKRLTEEGLGEWLAVLERGVENGLFAVGDLWIVYVSDNHCAPLHEIVLSHSVNNYLQKVGKHHILSTFDYPLVSPELAEFLVRSELRGFEVSPPTVHRAFREFRPLISLGEMVDHPSLDLAVVSDKNDRSSSVKFSEMRAEYLAEQPLYRRASILTDGTLYGHVTIPLQVHSDSIPSTMFDFAYLRQRIGINLVLSRRAVDMLRAEHFLSDLEARPIDIIKAPRIPDANAPSPRPFSPPDLLPAPPSPAWTSEEAIEVTKKWLVVVGRPPEPASGKDIEAIEQIAGRPIPIELARFLERFGLCISLPNCTMLFEPDYFQRDLKFTREMSSDWLPDVEVDRLLPLGSVGNGDVYLIKLDPEKAVIEAILLIDHEVSAPVDHYPNLALLLQHLLSLAAEADSKH